MPLLNGFGFITLLRDLPEEKEGITPVLVLSGHNDLASIQDVVELGISGYITKPISKQNFKNRILVALESPIIDANRIGSSDF